MLRMFGVTGLDRSGRPLAAEVVDRYVSRPARPARRRGRPPVRRGPPRVRDDAAGARPRHRVRCGRPGSRGRGPARQRAARRRRGHGPRARHLGARADRRQPDRPARAARGHRRRGQAVGRGARWHRRASVLGTREAIALAASGRRRHPGQRPGHPRARRPAPRRGRRRPVLAAATGSGQRGVETETAAEPAPAGSQRGLAELRQAVDGGGRRAASLRPAGDGGAATRRARAGRRRRVRADRHRRRRRRRRDRRRERRPGPGARRPCLRPPAHRPFGRTALVGPGPLVVGPDLSRGVPSDATTRAGRALALQLVGDLPRPAPRRAGGSAPRRAPCRRGCSRSVIPPPRPSPRSRSAGRSCPSTRSRSRSRRRGRGPRRSGRRSSAPCSPWRARPASSSAPPATRRWPSPSRRPAPRRRSPRRRPRRSVRSGRAARRSRSPGRRSRPARRDARADLGERLAVDPRRADRPVPAAAGSGRTRSSSGASRSTRSSSATPSADDDDRPARLRRDQLLARDLRRRPHARDRPLDGSADADVAILGAGYTGLWTAYELLRRDPSLKVTVLEREIAGFGASGRNGGWCAAGLQVSPANLERRFGRAGMTAIEDAVDSGVDEIGRVCADGGDRRRATSRAAASSSPAARASCRRSRTTGPASWQPAGPITTSGSTRRRPPSGSGSRARSAGSSGRSTPRSTPAGSSAALARAVERRGGTIHERTAVVDVERGRRERPAPAGAPDDARRAPGGRPSSSPARRT